MLLTRGLTCKSESGVPQLPLLLYGVVCLGDWPPIVPLSYIYILHIQSCGMYRENTNAVFVCAVSVVVNIFKFLSVLCSTITFPQALFVCLPDTRSSLMYL